MGSKSPQTDVGCVAVKTVAQALCRYPQASQTLHATYPHVAPSDITLNIAACARLTTTLTPIDHLNNSLTARFDDAFGAQIAHPIASSTSDSTGSQFIVGVHLIGVLVATSKGTLAIRHSYVSASCSKSTSNTTPHVLSFLIAPAPPPHFHGAPVFVSDWRFLPAHKGTCCPPMFEALQQDVHILIRPWPPPTPLSVPLSPQLSFEKDVLVSFHATVLAKSPTFKSSSASRRFFIEVTSPGLSRSNVGVFIVFDGNAVAWWPFIHPGLCIVFTDLKTAIAPALLDRYLLRTTSSTLIITFQPTTPQSPPPSPNAKMLPVIGRTMRQTNKPFIRSGTIVTYEGTITHCLPSALLELDNSVLLNLLELNGTIVGRHPYRTFRVGTRLRVTDVVVILRPSSPPCLYATARTFTDILFFADIHAASLNSTWSSQWRRLLSRFSLRRIVASEDILSALRLKFRHWFQPLGSSVERNDDYDITDPGVVGVLLGERGQPGLVQYLMFLFGDSEDILNFDRLPIRVMYKEFTAPATLKPRSFERTSLPAIAEVRDAVSHMWEELTNQRRNVQNLQANREGGLQDFSRNSGVCDNDCDDGIHDFFSFSAVVDGVLTGSDKRPGGLGVVLVGLVDGTPDGSGRVFISDATDSLNIRCVGGLKPTFFGAMVCIHRFNIVGDTQLFSSSSQQVKGHDVESGVPELDTLEDLTVIFEDADLSVVVDGPYVGTADGREDNRFNSGVSHKHASQRSPYRVSTVSTLSANVGKTGQSMVDCNGEISDAPLVCVFVEQVKSGGQCTISGRIMATMDNRSHDVWTVIDNDGTGFWRVVILLKGEAWLKVMACFEEGRLFALSCTQLEYKTNPQEYILKEAFDARASGRVLQLTSTMSDSLPWIENLGLGVYLRFAPKHDMGSCPGDDLLRLEQLGMSPEGEQYMYVSQAVEQFCKEVCTVESKLWRLYEWENELQETEERTMDLRGVVIRRQLILNEGGIETCNVEKVTVVDEIMGIFPLTVCFYDNFVQVHGLARGMLVVLRNIIRVPLQNARGGFEFVGNSTTSVKILSNDLLKTGLVPRQERCDCGILVNQPFCKVSEHLSLLFLDEFVQNSAPAAGLVRFYDARVEWMEMSVRVNIVSEGNCMECSLDKKRGNANSTRRQIHVEMIAEIDDGSRVGLIRCRGMGTCMRILSASHFQRECVRQLARECGAFEINVRDGQNAFLSRLRTQLHGTGMTVWHLLNSRGAGGIVAVLNSSASRPCRTDVLGSGALDRVVAKWFKMGYGRGMSIKCSPANRRLFLDAVEYFEENLLSSGPGGSREMQRESIDSMQPNRVSHATFLKLALDQKIRDGKT